MYNQTFLQLKFTRNEVFRLYLHRLATGQSEASIETVNHPLPVPSSLADVNTVKTNDLFEYIFIYLIAFGLAFSLSFHVATFVILPIQVSDAHVTSSRLVWPSTSPRSSSSPSR